MRLPDSLFIVISVGIILLVSILMVPETDVAELDLSSKKIEIHVPAVDSNGKGLVGTFGVEAVAGEGKTLTNIDNLLYFVDTQNSIQTAKTVAANLTGIDISKYNIIYEIDTGGNDGGVIEGPSAGAALAIATVAALENKEISSDVMITGSINPDGTIGRIGGIEAKMKAAKGVGAKVLLVPQGQGLRQSFTVESTCENVGEIRLCSTEYKPEPTIANNEDGLIVREVSDVSEALKYFIQ